MFEKLPELQDVYEWVRSDVMCAWEVRIKANQKVLMRLWDECIDTESRETIEAYVRPYMYPEGLFKP